MLRLSNVTINNSTFNNNGAAGLELTAHGTINNSVISGNRSGIIFSEDITLNDVILANNKVAVEIPCASDLQLTLNHVQFVGNGADFGSEITDCGSNQLKVVMNDSVFMIISQSEGEFALDCASVDGYAVNLLDGNRVQLFCPVSGTAHVSGLDTTTLPAPLPADYSYASAFSLDILQSETPISVITEGGYLKASFDASSLQPGDTYSILYWDNGTWVPLQELSLDETGREILSDVKLVTEDGSPRVEVSTNFPGIFVLAQH